MAYYTAPSTQEKSFNCPRCGALAKQFWYELFAETMDKNSHPTWYREDLEEFLKSPEADGFSSEDKTELLELAKKVNSMDVCFHGRGTSYNSYQVRNLHVSTCYNCDGVSVWIGQKLAFPNTSTEFHASEDMPASVKADFDEAAEVFNVSPRAAAAFLRVEIEKLCNEINGKKLSVFKGIGELVKKGLDEKVQRALDVVRVTGNDAVHPGQIDINDTPEDAKRLFKLINIIVEKLITVPREIDSLYEEIPEEKRKAIEARDAQKSKK